MSDAFISDVFTWASATDKPLHAVGTAKTVAGNEYIYIRNGATLVGTAHYPAMDVGTLEYFVVTPDVTNKTSHVCRGVYMTDLAVNEYGWIQSKGYHHTCNLTASVETTHFPLMVVTDGYFGICTAAGEVFCAYGAEVTTAAAATVSILLDCPTRGRYTTT